MKTTIEVAGHQIVIEENEGMVMVSAMKDGETVEEFSLSSEGSEMGEGSPEESDMKTFGEFGHGEEEDFKSEEGEESQDEVQDEVQDEIQDELEEEEEEEEEKALESFQSFINKKKK